MKALLVILVSSLALGCAQERQFTLIEIKGGVPKSAKKTVKSKPVAVVGKDGKRTDSQFVVYDVGQTINENGDLVGPHKVYRLVETSRWILGKPKMISPKTFVSTPTDEIKKAVEEAKEAARKAEAAEIAISNKTQVDPNQGRQADNGAPALPDFPSPSPSPDANKEAFQKFTHSADPNVP
jgi:hypothetical protein